MNNLPDEMIYEILTFLNFKIVLLNVSLTCKNFYSITNHDYYWKYIFFIEFSDFEISQTIKFPKSYSWKKSFIENYKKRSKRKKKSYFDLSDRRLRRIFEDLKDENIVLGLPTIGFGLFFPKILKLIKLKEVKMTIKRDRILYVYNSSNRRKVDINKGPVVIDKFCLRECTFFDYSLIKDNSVYIVTNRKYGKKRSFIVSAEISKKSVVDGLKLSLKEEMNGIFKGYYKTKTEKNEEEKEESVIFKDFSVLDCNKLCTWLTTCGYLELIPLFREYEINGKKLGKLKNLDDFKRIINCEREFVHDFYFEYLRDIIKNPVISITKRELVVYKKLKCFKDYNLEGKRLLEMCGILSDTSSFKEYFFNAHKNVYNMERLKVTVIITERFPFCKGSKFDFATNRNMNFESKLPDKFPIAHCGIKFGKWYFQWNDSSLIIPKLLGYSYRSNAHFIEDCVRCLCVIHVDKENNIFDKISSLCQKYNTECTFYNEENQLNPSSSAEFVLDFLKLFKIDIYSRMNNALPMILSEIKEKGFSILNFEPSKKLKDYLLRDYLNREEFRVHKKEDIIKWVEKCTFKTHQELDDFYKKISKQIMEFDDEFPFDYSILRIIDRIFWVRHINDERDERYTPLSYIYKRSDDLLYQYAKIPDDKRTGCPFQYPSNYY